jgi:hypothetical protein
MMEFGTTPQEELDLMVKYLDQSLHDTLEACNV